MRYLTKEQVLLIHSMVIDETGGSHGVRDYGAILSLESLPRQSAFGKELYPTLFSKAAVYARNIISGHPFVDGNKRTAMTAASVFLENNRYKLIAEKGTVEKFALLLIKKKLTIETIASWFEKNTERI
ncbi:MAG: type II toxin-antitoxin system death-on-curing family toxin [Candidatus Wildermuthbacteria bacterium]|nr:type II toxin-antitoxin system death-on-curing family toxin [Candidatus Wildermuthbacteria bacterium]